MSKHVAKNLVVDSGAFIKRAALHNVGENFYTVAEVTHEIRDQSTRDWLHTLPYVLKFREPLPEAIKIVTEFAQKTGDSSSLSATDIRVIALVYTLEKELVGTDHIRTQPTNKVEWVTPQRCPDNNATLMPGFYVKKKKSSSAEKSRTESESSAMTEVTDKMADINVVNSCDASELSPAADVAEVEDSQEDVDTVESFCSRSNLQQLSVNLSEVQPSLNEYIHDDEDGDSNSAEQISDDNGVEDDDDDDDDDDDEGWITPSNIEAMKQATISLTQAEVTDLPVACVTTDYAMQNVLIQMGLHVISVDGMLIRRTHSKILRCYGCGKVMADCRREFCSKCGNKTLSRVTVSYNDDGTVQYFLSRYKTFSTRGLRYSLPMPKGGKYAVNPKLCEDQRQPQQRTSKKSKMKVDVFDPNYSALVSPFTMNDVNSRSAMLGYTSRQRGPGHRRRNPNENNKHYGHRK